MKNPYYYNRPIVIISRFVLTYLVVGIGLILLMTKFSAK
jgi:hypothetical protein